MFGFGWGSPARASIALAALLMIAACGDDTPPTEADAGPEPCRRDSDCDDGVFCNGAEMCMPEDPSADATGCVFLEEPCLAAQVCDEEAGRCITDCDINGDADNDGVPAPECGGEDCDDGDPNRFPGNTEVCDVDDVDEDCDPSTVGDRDVDGDSEIASLCCNRNAMGQLLCGFDCNDARRGVNTTTSEVCDRFDNDCDGMVDEGVTVAVFADNDNDGYGTGEEVSQCADARGFALVGGDCDDNNAAVRPDWIELCDRIDNNCNDIIDENTSDVVWYPDADGDGFGVSATSGGMMPTLSCAPVDGASLLPGDCDDSDPLINPGAGERCNGRDDDCNGRADFEIEEGDTEDDDGDGAPDARCPDLMGMGDCNDLDQFVRPGVEELCDMRDNDCDMTVDEDVMTRPWYRDMDGDGFGDTDDSVEDCGFVAGRVLVGGDCNDSDDTIRPGGVIDGCQGRPRVDDDCDDAIDETPDLIAYYRDTDGDGIGAGDPIFACTEEGGRVALSGDCSPLDGDVFPGNDEDCSDGADQDCDTLVDCEDSDCDTAPACARTKVLVLIDGDMQSVEPNRFYAQPVVIRVDDLMGTPLSGQEVSLQSVGFSAVSRTEMSDANGFVRFQLQAPLTPGMQQVVFTSTGARNLAVPMTVSQPADGTLTTIINPDFSTNSTPDVGPVAASEASGSSIYDVAVASNGNVYFSRDSNHGVYLLQPDGLVRRFAGTGTSGFSGDNGLAVLAALRNPQGLALNPAEDRLYIADSGNGRVRVINLTTNEIRTVAGGGTVGAPTYGDGGPATVASLRAPRDIAVTSDGTIWIGEASGSQIRRVRPDGVIETPIPFRYGTAELEFRGCSTRCPLALDADERLLFGGNFVGTRTSSSAVGIARLEPDGTLTHVLGYRTGTTAEEGQSVRTLVSRLSDIAVAPDGAIFYANDTTHRVRRIDPPTGAVTTVAGTGTNGFSGDGGPAPMAQLNAPYGIDFDDMGQLYITDRNNRALRTVWGPVTVMATMVSLAPAAGDMTMTNLNGPVLPSLSVRVEAMDGTPVDGREVLFEAVTPGTWVQSESVFTSGGIASTAARIGLVEGDNTFQARVFDLSGAEISGSPLELTVSGNTPRAGNLFSLVNVEHSGGDPSGFDVASVMRGDRPIAAVSDKDGNLYVAFSNDYRIIRVLPDGRAEVFAGTGVFGTTGDFQNRLLAGFAQFRAMAYDEMRNRIYVATSDNRIRFIDLTDDRVQPFAGGGTVGAPSYGDGGPATSAQLFNISSMAVDEDGLVYLTNEGSGNYIRVINPTTTVIDRVFEFGSRDASGIYTVRGCGCRVAIDSMNRLILQTTLRATPGGVIADNRDIRVIYRVESTGTFTPLVGAFPDDTSENILGLQTSVGFGVVGMTVDPAGNIVFAPNSAARVRRYNMTSQRVTTIAGTGSPGANGEHVAATAAQLDAPWGLTYWQGHLVIPDQDVNTVRILW